MPEPPHEPPIKVENTEKISAQDSETEPQGTEPKIWSIDDPLQYTPPKPDGDPWAILLEPLMKKDKLRCEAWKDEVQNLLIFAGLFSAVVTAFIVESYKGLQPDPNDTIISILSHISTRLENPVNNTSITSSMSLPTFSPTAPSIQINALWFISLVLSLTTVLVGIISLQWLREHLSYPDDSPRKNYAFYQMRNEGLERWHVPKVFTTLPLLLQCALVLFLAGLIDFLQAFRVLAVLIPVSAIAGITLLFLVVTTILPTHQGLSLYFQSSAPQETRPPAQCPYKSPQSHAVRTMSIPIFRLCNYSYPLLRSISHRFLNFSKEIFRMTPMPPLKYDEFILYISSTWTSRTWSSFDQDWLAVRDAYMRRALDRPLHFQQLGQQTDSKHNVLPIIDMVSGLNHQISDVASYHAAYHAFVEICDLTLLPMHPQSHFYSPGGRVNYNQNAYLQDLIRPQEDSCLAEFFMVDKLFQNSELQAERTTFALALKQQSIFSFLDYTDNLDLRMHGDEIRLRLIWYFHRGIYEICPANPGLHVPRCLDLRHFGSWKFGLDADANEYNAMALQVFDITSALLKEISNETRPHEHSEHIYPRSGLLTSVLNSMPDVYFIITDILINADAQLSESDNALRAALNSLVSIINNKLEHEILYRLPTDGRPSLLFYAASSYVYSFRAESPKQAPVFDTLHSTLCNYKRLTVDLGVTDQVAEQQLLPTLNGVFTLLYNTGLPIFSESWWKDFEDQDHESGNDASLHRAGEGSDAPFSIRTTPVTHAAKQTESLHRHSSNNSEVSSRSKSGPTHSGAGNVTPNPVDISHLHPENHFSQSSQELPNVGEGSSLRNVRANDEIV